MKKRHLHILVFGLLLHGSVLAQSSPDSTLTPPPPQQGNHPRFIDLNGDGINDLAPDRDGDGIPDALDPMFQGPKARYRYGWYRSMPDSVMSDSLSFRGWWEGEQKRPNWRDAWNNWQNIVREAGGLEILRDRWRRDGMTPREIRRRIIEDRRRRGGGSGGTGGGGNGGRGGGRG